MMNSGPASAAISNWDAVVLGVEVNSAVAGEMLGGGEDAAVALPRDRTLTEFSHFMRASSEATLVAREEIPVLAHIQDRRQILIYSQSLQPPPSLQAYIVCLIGGGDIRLGDAVVQPLYTHDLSTLLVRRDEERVARIAGRHALQVLDQLGELVRVLDIPAEEDHAPGMDGPQHLLRLRRQLRPLYPDHEELADSLLPAQLR
jgi:hypothetical protein